MESNYSCCGGIGLFICLTEMNGIKEKEKEAIFIWWSDSYWSGPFLVCYWHFHTFIVCSANRTCIKPLVCLCLCSSWTNEYCFCFFFTSMLLRSGAVQSQASFYWPLIQSLLPTGIKHGSITAGLNLLPKTNIQIIINITIHNFSSFCYSISKRKVSKYIMNYKRYKPDCVYVYLLDVMRFLIVKEG